MKMKDSILTLLFLILGLIGISFLSRCGSVHGLKIEKGLEMGIREVSEISMVNESNFNAKSGKSWHAIEIWKFTMPTIAVFSLVDLFRLLRSSSDKIDDLDRVFTIETVHNIRTKLCKKIRKFHRKILDSVYELVGKRRSYSRTKRTN